MTVFLETNKKLHLCENGMIVCPIHPQHLSMSNYPVTTLRDYYPIEYSHMMHRLKEGMGKGDVLLSDSNGDEVIVWVCFHNAYNVAYKMDWIEEAIKTMSKMRLHDRDTIYFPGLGYYEEDGVDQEEVLKMVHNGLSDGIFNVKFLTHY